MKVGLVLGAGGVLGGAWLTGGLNALARETGWDPGSADFIVGTSAGSMVGALIGAGVPPWFMVAHSRGESFAGVLDADGRPAAEADRAAGAVFRVHRGLPGLGPGSLRMVATAPVESAPPASAPAGGRLAAGRRDLHRLAQGRGSPRGARALGRPPQLLGRHVRLRHGETGALRPRGLAGGGIADAVAASCAIPGFYRPVRIGGRRYVDGGVCSASNLDLLAGRGLDLVICLNPLSSSDDPRSANPLDWPSQLSRAANRRRLAHEARKVRGYGTKVVLIEPTSADLRAMGRNLMSPARRDDVIAMAEHTVARRAPLRRRARPARGPARGRVAQDRPARRPAVGVAGHRPLRPEGRVSGAGTSRRGAHRGSPTAARRSRRRRARPRPRATP